MHLCARIVLSCVDATEDSARLSCRECPVTKARERRKVAKPEPAEIVAAQKAAASRAQAEAVAAGAASAADKDVSK